MIATAHELFEARHHPSVVAVCSDALDLEPECVPLLLLRARSRIALRHDLDAQADLRDVVRLDRHCAIAYRLLGELAARGEENESAAQLFAEALRLDPDDREAYDWLQIVDVIRPAAGAATLPAHAPAAGRFSPGEPPARFARGTQPPKHLEEEPGPRTGHEGPTRRRGSGPDPVRERERPRWSMEATFGARNPLPAAQPPEPDDLDDLDDLKTPPVRLVVPQPVHKPETTLTGHPAMQGARPRATPRPAARTPAPELPGFAEYLVESGVMTRERLRAAQAYQRSMKVHLATAIITLGLAPPQRIEWALAAHRAAARSDD